MNDHDVHHQHTINLNVKFIGDPRTDEILCLLRKLSQRQEIEMALGQDILDAVTEETTAVDSFLALVQGLIDNNTIPAATGAKILESIRSTKDKVNAAIVANTPAAPQP